jgi:UDP:flavonoid glycosyltransferase YjiC (YdhE family)
MQVLVLGLGSAGDVHPMVALSLALRECGHQVVLAASPVFRLLAERRGLSFRGLGTEQDYYDAINDPDLWHPNRAFRVIARRLMLPAIRPVYEWIAESYVPGETIVAAPATAFAARIANEKLGVPLATIHLQPSLIRSYHQSPAIAVPNPLDLLPRFAKRLFYRLVDALMIDKVLAAETNSFRAELGLPPVRRLFERWLHSPKLVLGFFPGWFAPPQPDWPPNIHLLGFPLYDESDTRTLPPELDQFLKAGDPPVVFTAGSAMAHGRGFFETSVEAAEKTGARAILLTQFPEQLPPALPAAVRHFTYIPFSQVLPRAAAFVHHGGIGTTAQAFAAGVPQLVVPFAHDQPDNAIRVQRLGAGLALARKAYHTEKVVECLDRLRNTAEIKAACRRYQHITKPGALLQACRLIEQLSETAAIAAAERLA